jgi:DNA-binding transcriptional regulator YiaG
MKHAELEAIREEIKFDKVSFSACLDIPYRTFQNYCYGINSIPEEIARKAMDLLLTNRALTQSIPHNVDANLKGGYCPNEARGE